MIVRKAVNINPKDLIFITVGKRSVTCGLKSMLNICLQGKILCLSCLAGSYCDSLFSAGR